MTIPKSGIKFLFLYLRVTYRKDSRFHLLGEQELDWVVVFADVTFISELQSIFSGVSKITFGFNDSLKGNIELRKAVKLMVMVYYSERTQI